MRHPTVLAPRLNSAGVDGGGIANGGTVTLTDSEVTKNKPNDCVGC